MECSNHLRHGNIEQLEDMQVEDIQLNEIQLAIQLEKLTNLEQDESKENEH